MWSMARCDADASSNLVSCARKGPRSPDGGLVVRTPSIGGAENAACFAYPLKPGTR